MQLARYCADLRKVNVQGCRNVADEGVVRIAESCPELSYLCLSNCAHLTDAALLSLAANSGKLTVLECASVSQVRLKFYGGFTFHHTSNMDKGISGIARFWCEKHLTCNVIWVMIPEIRLSVIIRVPQAIQIHFRTVQKLEFGFFLLLSNSSRTLVSLPLPVTATCSSGSTWRSVSSLPTPPSPSYRHAAHA